jgi:hypothetical protein
MFERVSAALPLLRRLMAAPAGRPEVLILAPPARAHREIGAQRSAVLLAVQPLSRLAILAKEGVNAAVVDSLTGWPLADVRAVVALSPAADDFSPGDLATLRVFLGRGGKVVTSPDVGAALAGAASGQPQTLYDGLLVQRGGLYVAQQGIAVLFEDQRHLVLAGFWQEVLGLESPQPGYRVVTDRYAFYYQIGAEPATLPVTPSFRAYGARYDDKARPAACLLAPQPAVVLGRREYILLRRAWWSALWPL